VLPDVGSTSRGRHCVEPPVEKVAQTTKRYLADHEARRRITETGYAFVTRELTLERSLTRRLAVASEGHSRSGP